MRLDLHCPRCRLCNYRTHVVPPGGDLGSPIVFVGEAPGETEDRLAQPFVGKAGRMLDRLLVEGGLSREDIMITNTVKCRPPDNRRPKPDEMEACFPYLEQELRPKRLIVALGRTACHDLLGRPVDLGNEANKPVSVQILDREIELLPTYHPSACLFNLTARAGLRQTIALVRARL
jgi:uracil-DNA glycosylase family 4